MMMPERRGAYGLPRKAFLQCRQEARANRVSIRRSECHEVMGTLDDQNPRVGRGDFNGPDMFRNRDKGKTLRPGRGRAPGWDVAAMGLGQREYIPRHGADRESLEGK